MNLFIVSASGGQKNHDFVQVLTLGGSCTDPFLPMRVKFGVLEQTEGLYRVPTGQGI